MDTTDVPQVTPPAAEKTSSAPSPVSEKNTWQRLTDFCREVWNDHDFWIRALAVKGGASAIIIASVVAISYVVALPFVLAATGIAACLGLIGLSLFGIYVGTATGWDKLKHIYSKTVSTTPPTAEKKAAKPLFEKLLENPRIKKFSERPLIQKFSNSRAWKYTRIIAKKQQDMFLTGLAGGGSIFMGTLSLITLVTVLPVITIGSALTTGVVAVGGLVSGVYGIYLSGQKFLHSLAERRKEKKSKKDAKAELEAPAPAPNAPTAPVEAVAPDFNKAVTVSPAPEEAKKEEAAPQQAVTPAPPPAL